MIGAQEHLPDDLAALRYLDAVTTGDLPTVAELWHAASHDPRLERILAEIDAALVAEASLAEHQLLDRQSRSRSNRHPRRWPVRAAALGLLAAACWFMIVMRVTRDEAPRTRRAQAAVAHRANAGPVIDPTIRPTNTSRTPSDDLSAWLQARRAFRGEPPPTFAWPLRSTLTISFRSDLLD